MKFKTKGELLEYLGKDKKYVRLIDRMMLKGEVALVDGEYEYNNPAVESEKKLKDKIEGLEWLLDLKEGQIDSLNKEIEELKKNRPASSTPASDGDMSDLEYLNNEYIKLEENREQALRKCYEFMESKKIFDKEKNPFEDFFYWASGCELR